MVPKLVETIVIMRSNKGRIDFSDYKEENEGSSSSDEEDVESEGESDTVEEVEMEDNENNNEGENVSVNVMEDEAPQRTSTKKSRVCFDHKIFFSKSECKKFIKISGSRSEQDISGSRSK